MNNVTYLPVDPSWTPPPARSPDPRGQPWGDAGGSSPVPRIGWGEILCPGIIDLRNACGLSRRLVSLWAAVCFARIGCLYDLSCSGWAPCVFRRAHVLVRISLTTVVYGCRWDLRVYGCGPKVAIILFVIRKWYGGAG